MVIASAIVDVRLFKFIYSNAKERFDLRTLREIDLRRGWRYPKRSYQILTLLMIPVDVSLICIAISILFGSVSNARLTKVAIERVIISLMLLSVTVLEYYYPRRNCCKKDKTVIVAPQFEEDKGNKYRVMSASVLTDLDNTANRSILL